MNTRIQWLLTVSALLLLVTLVVQSVALLRSGRATAATDGWQVSSFEFATSRPRGPDGKVYNVGIIWQRYGTGAEPYLANDDTDIVSSAASALDSLGREHWQLVWSDGYRYIVQRPAGKYPYPSFSVEPVEVK